MTLGDEEARKRGVQKSILERGGPPTFDVAVEMLERNKWRVHTDVACAVDMILAGERSVSCSHFLIGRVTRLYKCAIMTTSCMFSRYSSSGSNILLY